MRLRLLALTVLVAGCSSANTSVTIDRNASRAERLKGLYAWYAEAYPGQASIEAEDIADIDAICQGFSAGNSASDFADLAPNVGYFGDPEMARDVAVHGVAFLCPEWSDLTK